MSIDETTLYDCNPEDPDCLLNDEKVRETLKESHSTRKLTYDRGENVFEAGKPIVGFYVICEGVIREVSSPSIGENITLKVFKPGDLLTGDAFLFDEEWYKTGAQTITEAEVLFIKKSVFPELMNVAGKKIGMKLAENMRYLRKNLEFSCRPVLKKTAYWLAKLFPDSSSEFKISNKELAEIVGCSHVTVSRKLSKLAEKELIQKEGQVIIVPDKSDLREEAVSPGFSWS